MKALDGCYLTLLHQPAFSLSCNSNIALLSGTTQLRRSLILWKTNSGIAIA